MITSYTMIDLNNTSVIHHINMADCILLYFSG